MKEQLKKGNKIETIKILREETGIGLKEAKVLIDRAHARESSGRDDINLNNISISSNVLKHLREGKKVDAIKTLRWETCIGLKDAKDLVEKALLENPDVKIIHDAEAKRSVINFLLFILAVILIVLLVYYFFSK
jgi:ribosomal protein L7/L12